MAILSDSGQFTDDQLRASRRVLSAAALTYVAAMASALLSLLRLVLIANRNSRD
jgi:Zn-dependent membrane protease YugP